jgi:GNAT superfamily N-acetyltransferase
MAEAIRIVDQPEARDIARLEAEIDGFNQAATGLRDGRWLAAFVRAADGRLRAGLSGHTWGGCCEIRFLWVRDGERRAGLGSALLGAAEREARARGCDQVVLSTHSFQAPGFYRRHGYVEVGRVAGYPRGHAQIWLCKRLP